MSYIKTLRERSGLSQAALAKLANTSQPQIKRLESGERDLTKDWAERLAPHLGTSPVTLMFPGDEDALKLPIVGRVGASTDGAIIQDTDHGPFGEIEAPIGSRGTEAAVEVSGHSMGLWAPDGSLILYDDRHEPPHEDMLGDVCVVGLPDGRTLVKRLLRGSQRGLFDLESLVGDTLRDNRVEWAAVVLMVIHPRHARRLRLP